MAHDPRRLPAVHRVLEEPAAVLLAERAGRDVAVAAVRRVLERHREHGTAGDAQAVAAEALADEERPALRPVLNATGVIVHTNLGRAPLAPEAVAALAATGGGYANLKLDLATGARGSRQDLVEGLLTELTGAPAALVVNNCAAALVLAIAALAHGREVVVSRGQMIEIGDGFRLPEVMAQAGARLVEVGATNRTRLADYASAIGPATGLLLRAHPSNFRVVGFAEEVGIDALAGLGREHGVAVLDDVGSGLLVADPVLPGEPALTESVRAGATLALASGDKLLGGPQAGFIIGRRDLVQACAKNPMARAVRLDKVRLAALEATLRLHRDPQHARVAPCPCCAWRTSPSTPSRPAPPRSPTRSAARSSRPRHGSAAARFPPSTSRAAAAQAAPDPAERLHAALRTGDPGVVARILDGRLVLDARTLGDDQVAAVVDAVRAARAAPC